MDILDIRFDKRIQRIVPLIAIGSAGILGLLIILITGGNPLALLRGILRGFLGINLAAIGTQNPIFNPRYIGEFLVSAMPLILTGLSVGFAFRTGLFNIGAEGQLLAGACGAIVVAFMFPDTLPRIVFLPVVCITGMVCGMVWGFVPGALKGFLSVSEIVVTIMLNYAALFITNYIYLLLPHPNTVKTEEIPFVASMESPFLSDLTSNSRLHLGIYVIPFVVVLYWFIIDKTRFGFELRATGFNPRASKLAGIHVASRTTLSMGIAGAFAGLAGVMIAVGTFNYGRVLTGFENVGFFGIAVALIGANKAFGILGAGLLLAGLQSSQPILQAQGIPRDIILIIVAIIVLFIAMQQGIRNAIEASLLRRMVKTRRQEESLSP